MQCMPVIKMEQLGTKPRYCGRDFMGISLHVHVQSAQFISQAIQLCNWNSELFEQTQQKKKQYRIND